jgi:hypothetical protein
VSTYEIGIKLKEDEKNIYLDYDFMGFSWCLVYNKFKDKCLLLKQSKPAQLKKLTEDEEEAYKEVLKFAIEYHHEKGDADLH